MRLILADESLLFREAIAMACRRDLGHHVAGQTGEGREAVDLCRKLQPDLLVLDVGLRGFNGFAVLEELREMKVAPRTIVLSAKIDDYVLLRVERSGVAGFVDKGFCTLRIFATALQVVDRGGRYFSEEYCRLRTERQNILTELGARLTSKEQILLTYIGCGLNDKEVAERAGIARSTAQWHRSNIMRKCGVSGTPKLMSFAAEHGFVVD